MTAGEVVYRRRSARVLLVDDADRILLFRDDFFLLRTAAYDIDTTGFQAVERTHITAHHWWTLDELEAATEPVYPLGLAALLADLLAGRIPTEPVRLPWHR
jgi:hypothetical protein